MSSNFAFDIVEKKGKKKEFMFFILFIAKKIFNIFSMFYGTQNYTVCGFSL